MATDSKYHRVRKGALPYDYPKKDAAEDTWRSIRGNSDGSSDVDTGSEVQTRTRVNDPETTTRVKAYKDGGPVGKAGQYVRGETRMERLDTAIKAGQGALDRMEVTDLKGFDKNLKAKRMLNRAFDDEYAKPKD